jgi:DNA polymerase-1
MKLMQDSPKWITFDTETTGLHIKKDKPFLASICWDGKVFVFPANKIMLGMLYGWASSVERIYAHNTSYDMHMVANIVGDSIPLAIENWGDTMGLARLSFEAISTRDGGDSLALKRIADKYIDPTASRFEKEVKAWLKAKEAQNNKILTAMLHGFKDSKGKWSKKRLTDGLNNGTEPIPQEVLDILNNWREECPKPTYQDVPLEIMIPYLAVDVILTNILVRKSLPVVEYRQQLEVMKREFDLIPVVWKMERAGIAVDRDYLVESNKKLEDYINDLTIQMHLLAGMEFNVGQHAKIKKIYESILGEEPESTDKKFLKKMQKMKGTDGAELAKIINKMRTLEKWKATYIERILDVSEYDGRFYSQMNQFNPVSGRFSGDAQQFPKKRLLTLEGDAHEKQNGPKSAPAEFELFHPRRAFTGRIYYLDYSQVELRVQGHYTIPFGGDRNLCRAYMPFGCRHFQSGEIYDYKTVEGRSRWNEKNGEVSAWLMEDGTPWVATDVHLATTLKALDKLEIDASKLTEEQLESWRSLGKTFNFMRNYGGGPKMAAEVLEIDLEEAIAMAEGYTDAFPLVVLYQDKVSEGMRKGYVVNMRGRRYYISDSRKFYKAGNYLIQGTSADILKEVMIKIDRLLTENDCKAKMILCVHDELQFEIPENEDWLVPKIKEIMESTTDIMVPIVAEVEFTSTNWAEKRKVH